MDDERAGSAPRAAAGRQARKLSRMRRMPGTQPRRALAAGGLYLAAVALAAGLMSNLTSGWAAVLGTVLAAVGLLVPFIVLGQRPAAPSRTPERAFPLLGQPGASPDIPKGGPAA